MGKKKNSKLQEVVALLIMLILFSWFSYRGALACYRYWGGAAWDVRMLFVSGELSLLAFLYLIVKDLIETLWRSSRPNVVKTSSTN